MEKKYFRRSNKLFTNKVQLVHILFGSFFSVIQSFFLLRVTANKWMRQFRKIETIILAMSLDRFGGLQNKMCRTMNEYVVFISGVVSVCETE